MLNIKLEKEKKTPAIEIVAAFLKERVGRIIAYHSLDREGIVAYGVNKFGITHSIESYTREFRRLMNNQTRFGLNLEEVGSYHRGQNYTSWKVNLAEN